MESENLNQYLLLFHLLEYWDREWRKNMTDTWIRFEACDMNDPDTLVGLKYEGSLPPPSPRAKNPSHKFSFDPNQTVDSSIEKLGFFDNEGNLVEVAVRELPIQRRRYCRLERQSERLGVNPENIRTLTSHSWYGPETKKRS